MSTEQVKASELRVGNKIYTERVGKQEIASIVEIDSTSFIRVNFKSGEHMNYTSDYKVTILQREKPVEKKTLHQVALENLIAQGMKVGSTVKVIAKARDWSGGWNNTWESPEMNERIGNEFTVHSIDGAQGIEESSGTFKSYPAFCLELVEATPKPREITVRLNDHYSAVVTAGKDTVTVGCQEIGLIAINELISAIELLSDD